MNKCPKCGTEFEGKFCPECGEEWTELKTCPKCGNLVGGDTKFCAECGYAFYQREKTAQRAGGASAWARAHKKLLGWGAAALVLVLILSIVIPVAVINRHNGTYYLYENEEYNYEKYFTLKGNTYTDESGYSCDVDFDGSNVSLYAELFGIKDVMARGTINGDVLKLEIMGAEVTYAKKGHIHKLKDEVIKEATCDEEGVAVACCYCGFQKSDTIKLSPLGHDFQNDVCNRCGIKYAEFRAFSLRYTLNEEKTEYTVSGIGACKDDSVLIIPSKYKGLLVTSIGDDAFERCRGLTSITIPDSVTSIGRQAFSECSGLTGELNIPDSVTKIGSGAFYGCSGLTSVTIPDSVTSIGDEAFYGCSGLTSVTIPNSVTKMGDGAFRNCSGLTSVTIPDSVTSIERYAFYECSGLTSVTIPDSVTSIGVAAFGGCGLTEIEVDENNQTYHVQGNCLIETKSKTLVAGCKTSKIPDDGSVTSIGERAFMGCSGLTSVKIGSGVTSIGEFAFAYCYGLTSINIPESVTTIGDYAFRGCSGLTSVDIPNSVTEIGKSAFYDTAYYNNDSNWDKAGVLYIGNHLIQAKYTISGSYSICSGTKTIADGAFYDRDGLTSITIPDSVTEIGAWAFYDCDGLISVIIPDSVTSIRYAAFSYCDNLKEIHFENPNGWKVSRSDDMSGAETVSGLGDPARAAQYLTGTYFRYYWKREG